jgi:hypothetical protein
MGEPPIPDSSPTCYFKTVPDGADLRGWWCADCGRFMKRRTGRSGVPPEKSAAKFPSRASSSGNAGGTTSSSTCPSSTCPSGVTSCVQRSESSGAVQQLIPIGKRGSVPRAACLVYHHHSFSQCGCLMGLKGWSDDRLPQRSPGREKT